MKLKPTDPAIFDAEWLRLQERFCAKGGQEWAEHELEQSRLGDRDSAPGGGEWAGFALDLASGRTESTPFGSSQHQWAVLSLVADVEGLLDDQGSANSAHEAFCRVAEFRLAKVRGYETPWAIRYQKSRGRNQSPDDLRDWFLRERIALPLFCLYVGTRMPDRLRIMTETQ